MFRWAVVIVVYLASIIACFNQFKVPPLTGELISYFHVGKAQVGLMMSIFAITGVILAFPTAMFLRKFGPRPAGLAALGFIILGCLLGGVANSPATLMVGRVIEGVGLGSMGVIAPAVIAMYFRGKEIAVPMGIWATWFPVGSSLGYNLTHPVTHFFGSWRGAWWFGALCAAVIFILYAIIIRRPKDAVHGHGAPHGHGHAHHAHEQAIPFLEALKNGKIWSLGAAFFLMMLGSLGFLTWAPEYFSEHFGIARQAANSYASIGFMTSIPGGIVAGIVMSRLMHRRRTILVICALLSALIYPFGFALPFNMMVPYLVSIGFITGFVCAATFAMVPKVMGIPHLASIGMGVILFMQGWSNLLAMPSMGYVISGGNWEKGIFPTIVVQLLGIGFAVLFASQKSGKKKPHPERVGAVVEAEAV